jgi:hypothetical protein
MRRVRLIRLLVPVWAGALTACALLGAAGCGDKHEPTKPTVLLAR